MACLVEAPVLLAQAQEDFERLRSIRRDLHMHPELGLCEFRTAELIERELGALGIAHERVGETGILGVIEGTGEGDPSVIAALRADIDALPLQEVNDVPYRSLTDGVKHACGHDAHTTCLLGAARLLALHRGDFAGTVRLIFQPAEEIGQGVRPFVEAGCLSGVRRIYGLHCAPDVASGTIGVKLGVNNASTDHFTVRVQGRSAHVSMPHLGIDALYIASQIVVGLQALVTRRTSPIEPLLVGVGKLEAGTAYNAIAASAVLEGTTRAISPLLRAQIREQINELVDATARMYGGCATVEWEDFAAPLINDDACCEQARAVIDAVAGPGHWHGNRILSMGGDNFADLMIMPEPNVPGAYLYLGICSPDVPGSDKSLHALDFDLDERAIPLGAAALAGCALDVLGALEK